MDGELLGPDVRVALLGAEGSGKTCLSHTLVGKDYQDTPPTEGADHMEIIVESTTDWRPLTDREKLDDLEQQKYLEAMFVLTTKQQQRSILASTNNASSSLESFNVSDFIPTMPSSALVSAPSMPTKVSHVPNTGSVPPYGVFQSIPPYTLQHNVAPLTQATALYPNFLSQTQPFYQAQQGYCYPVLSSANNMASVLDSPSMSTSSNPMFNSSTLPLAESHSQLSFSKLSHANEPLISADKFKKLKAIEEHYNPNKRYINIWDFAGQAVFQHTHGVFVSDEVVCLIVFDASLSLDEKPERRYPGDRTPRRTVLQTICYWMELISSRVSQPSTSDKDQSVLLPTFILVGTHIDKLHPDIAMAEKIAFKTFIPLFQKELVGKPYSLHIAGSKKGNLSFKKGSPSLFFVCNKQPKRVPAVINKLKQVIVQSTSITRQTRPTRYVEVERKLMLLSLQEKIYVVGLDEFAVIADSCGLPTGQEQLLKVTSYLHHKGALLHYPRVETLFDIIILSPSWMARLLTFVLTSLICWPTDPQLAQHAKKRQMEGLLEEELIDWSVKQFNESETPENRIATDLCGVPVIELFEKFHLMVDITQSSLAGKSFEAQGRDCF